MYKKRKKKRVCVGGAGDKCMKRGHERESGSALDRGRPWESQKQKKGHAPTHPHTHAESLSALKQTVSHLFSILLGVCNASCTFPSIVFCQSPFSLSVFFFLSSHSSHLSQRCRGGVESRSFCNPLTAPGYFFFSNLFYTTARHDF